MQETGRKEAASPHSTISKSNASAAVSSAGSLARRWLRRSARIEASDIRRGAAAADELISLEPPRYAWLRGPRGTYASLMAYKTFRLREGLNLELRGEANNALNHPIFGNPAVDMNNPVTFGTITSAGGTRNVNLSVKIKF